MPDYYPDLEKFSLNKLQKIIETTRLLPSQKILQENTEERFACLKKNGIENLQQLQEALQTKKNILAFAQKTGLPIEFLTLLRREVNSYQPKPILLKDFPGINPEDVQKLAQIGIRNTKQLFERVTTPDARAELMEQTQIEPGKLLELTKLSDMARMKWVGPKFARLLVESEYDTAEKVIQADYTELYQDLIRTNQERGIYKGKFGLNDMKSWVKVMIQEVPLVIQY
jgi:hypothetical protein